MKEYTCFTDKGHWKFHDEDDKDAARLGMYLAWRDGEEFDRIEGGTFGNSYTICLCVIDLKNAVYSI